MSITLFKEAKTWKQPKCPLVDEWIRKMYVYTPHLPYPFIYIYIHTHMHTHTYIHTTEYYSIIKNNEIIGTYLYGNTCYIGLQF